MKLSPSQFSKIQKQASLNKIYYSDIKAEFLDHYACEIEKKMESGESFEQAFAETQHVISPKRFQMQILLATHLGMAKQLLQSILRPMILLKSALLCLSYLLIIFLLEDLTPEASEKHIKTLIFSGFIGIALISFSRDLLKNSALVASANTFWLIFCIGLFALNVDLLVFFGLSPEASLYTITFFLSLLSISGLTLVTAQYKKLKAA